MRIALALVVVTVRLAAAQPAPPADPCGRAAFKELAQVRARIATLEAAGAATLDDILDVAMSSPTSYVMQAPGSERLRALLASQDPAETRSLLGALKTDYDTLLATPAIWRYRCEAYPSSHLPPPTLRPKELAARRTLATIATAAHARAAECATLQARAFKTPEARRGVFARPIDRCHQDLDVARQACERDFAGIIHGDSFGPYQASIAVSNVIDLRKNALARDDVAAVRRRVEPMLDALRPPLSALAAPSRAALAKKDPVDALYSLSGSLKILYSPCEALWTSSSRCVISPSRCRKTID